jgi:hypothetical protein
MAPYDDVAEAANAPLESVNIAGRLGTISTIVEPCDGERLNVVVQGFLESRWRPSNRYVARDSFYKLRDGSCVEKRKQELYDCD